LNNKKFLQSFPIGIKLDTYNINRASEVGIRQSREVFIRYNEILRGKALESSHVKV